MVLWLVALSFVHDLTLGVMTFDSVSWSMIARKLHMYIKLSCLVRT